MYFQPLLLADPQNGQNPLETIGSLETTVTLPFPSSVPPGLATRLAKHRKPH